MNQESLPLVSVVIPAYNSEEYIGRCLDSLYAQTYRNWFATVVIAPCSDDTYQEVRKRFSTRISVIREGEKTNCATARNEGYENSIGDYLYFLDADDWLESQCLETMVTMLENRKGLSWCVSYQMTHWDNRTYIIDMCPGMNHLIGGIGGILFRRSCLENIIKDSGELFDETLNHTDDADLVLRARKYPHIMIPVVLSNYQWNYDGLTANTHWLEQQSGLVKMMIKRRAWDLLPGGIFNLCIVIVNEIFHTDIVKLKKRLLP
jgi:glycosyltransferase involved in cell wall biosynthesis